MTTITHASSAVPTQIPMVANQNVPARPRLSTVVIARSSPSIASSRALTASRQPLSTRLANDSCDDASYDTTLEFHRNSSLL